MESKDKAGAETSIFVEYYTDPLCSWSWAFEAPWRYLRYACDRHLEWCYRMGGLLADWSSYHDPFQDIRNPSQMGPQWFQVQEISGMLLDYQIWNIDPPTSSYPTCMAFKAAECQGQTEAENYLRRLREAVMLQRRNITHQDILLAVAEETSLDLSRFRDDLTSQATLAAFRQDMRDAAYYSIGRFPTLILHRADGRGIVLTGYRPYDALQSALEYLVPGIIQRAEMPQEELAIAYTTYWRRITAQEMVEVLGCPLNQVVQLLDSLVTRRLLAKADNLPSEMPIYTPVLE